MGATSFPQSVAPRTAEEQHPRTPVLLAPFCPARGAAGTFPGWRAAVPFLHNLHGALGRLLALLGPGDRAAKGCSRQQLLVLHAWPSPSASLSRLRPPLGRLLCLFAPSSLLGQRFGVPRQHRAGSHTAPNACGRAGAGAGAGFQPTREDPPSWGSRNST